MNAVRDASPRPKNTPAVGETSDEGEDGGRRWQAWQWVRCSGKSQEGRTARAGEDGVRKPQERTTNGLAAGALPDAAPRRSSSAAWQNFTGMWGERERGSDDSRVVALRLSISSMETRCALRALQTSALGSSCSGNALVSGGKETWQRRAVNAPSRRAPSFRLRFLLVRSHDSLSVTLQRHLMASADVYCSKEMMLPCDHERVHHVPRVGYETSCRIASIAYCYPVSGTRTESRGGRCSDQALPMRFKCPHQSERFAKPARLLGRVWHPSRTVSDVAVGRACEAFVVTSTLEEQ
jgi:hypothetical protein